MRVRIGQVRMRLDADGFGGLDQRVQIGAGAGAGTGLCATELPMMKHRIVFSQRLLSSVCG
jgi:hypothetical protein